MIGITGTDSKTSTTTIIQTLIGKDNCGYIGTNGYSYKDKKEILRIQLLIVIIYIGILMILLKLDANIVQWKQVVKPF